MQNNNQQPQVTIVDDKNLQEVMEQNRRQNLQNRKLNLLYQAHKQVMEQTEDEMIQEALLHGEKVKPQMKR